METLIRRTARNVKFRQINARPGHAPPELEVTRSFGSHTQPVRKETIALIVKLPWRWNLELKVQISQNSNPVVLTASRIVECKFEDLHLHVADLETLLPTEHVVSYGLEASIVGAVANTTLGE